MTLYIRAILESFKCRLMTLRFSHFFVPTVLFYCDLNWNEKSMHMTLPEKLYFMQYNIILIKVVKVQNTLLKVQPGFKATLLSGVEQFTIDVNQFYKDYESK